MEQGGSVRCSIAWQLGQTGRKAFVPLAFEMGEAFQFDWSDEPLVIGGIYRELQVSHMKLCASRAFWLGAYPSQGHEMLFDAGQGRAHRQQPAASGRGRVRRDGVSALQPGRGALLFHLLSKLYEHPVWW